MVIYFERALHNGGRGALQRLGLSSVFSAWLQHVIVTSRDQVPNWEEMRCAPPPFLTSVPRTMVNNATCQQKHSPRKETTHQNHPEKASGLGLGLNAGIAGVGWNGRRQSRFRCRKGCTIWGRRTEYGVANAMSRVASEPWRHVSFHSHGIVTCLT